MSERWGKNCLCFQSLVGNIKSTIKLWNALLVINIQSSVSLLNSMSHLSFGIILIITLTLIIRALGKVSVLVESCFFTAFSKSVFFLFGCWYLVLIIIIMMIIIKIKRGTVGVGYVHRRPSNTKLMSVLACPGHAAMLWCTCSRDFTRVAFYLVVQMDLPRWKVVCCGQLTLHWTLDHWQQPSRWANHAITRQQCIDSKMYRIEI